MFDPSIADLAKQVTDLKSGAADLSTAANIVWTLVTGFLVMFMQAGFALVETGLCRKKNAAHVMAMNVLVYSIGILGFWTVGFATQMGGVGAMATFGNDATLSSEFVINIAGKPFGLSAILIGAIAGVLVVVSAMFVEQTLKIDDPVGASSVHGTCGAWGVLSLGLFANGSYGDGFNGVPGKVTGLFFGNSAQFFAECIGVLVNFVYVGGMTAIALFAIGKVVGNRVSIDEELAGLDIPEMGVLAFLDDAVPQNLRDAAMQDSDRGARVAERVPG
jgi:ammonia channel protein AmtB